MWIIIYVVEKLKKAKTTSDILFLVDSFPNPVIGEVIYSNISQSISRNNIMIILKIRGGSFFFEERFITNAAAEKKTITKEIILKAVLSMKRKGMAKTPANSISLICLSENKNARVVPEKICTMLHRVNIPSSIWIIRNINL